MRPLLTLAATLALTGCTLETIHHPPPSRDASTMDATTDAAMGDGGIGDAGELDASTDAGDIDANRPDACATAELCNGVDDDCDEAVDEGISAELGGRVPVTSGGAVYENSHMAPLAGGYAVVWQGVDRRIQYQRVRSDGSPIDATPIAVDGSGTDDQTQPRVAVVGDRAVVLWKELTALRARSFSLTGGAPSATVEVAPAADGRFVIVPFGRFAVAAWLDGLDTVVCQIDPPSATPVISPAIAYTRVGLVRGPTRPALVYVDAPDPYGLLFVNDVRAGDAGERIYVTRVVPGFAPDGALTPLSDVLVGPLFDAAIDPTLGIDDAGIAAVAISRDDTPGGDRRALLYWVTPHTFGTAPEVSAPTELSPDRIKLDVSVAVTGHVALAGWVEVTAGGADVVAVSAARGDAPSSLAHQPVLAFAGVTVAGSVGSGALLFGDGPTPTDPRDVYLQRFGCTP